MANVRGLDEQSIRSGADVDVDAWRIDGREIVVFRDDPSDVSVASTTNQGVLLRVERPVKVAENNVGNRGDNTSSNVRCS